MVDPRVLAYYAGHSPLTDPGRHAACFDPLPDDVSGLARVVTGLLVHPFSTELYGEPPASLDESWGIRTVADTLARMLEVSTAPLSVARGPGLRLRANCRNFAVLMVAMLRHQGVPARKRVGFAAYLPGPLPAIHEVAEYWDAARSRWVLVDPDGDEPVLAAQRAYFAAVAQPGRAAVDPHDLRPGIDFLRAGAVWRACRAGEADPDQFWDSSGSGALGIRVALLQDLDGLAKAELLSNDEWHPLLHQPEAELTATELAWLDRAAALAEQVDDHFAELQAFYLGSPYGRTVRAQLTARGLAECGDRLD